MKTIATIIVATAFSVLGVTQAAAACEDTCSPIKHPKNHKIVKKPVHVTVAPVQPDRHVTVSAQVNREGYCVNGKFMDMVVGQLEITDTIVYARYYKGIGITCTHLDGYTFTGTYVDAFGGIGNYAYFA